jgi:hypothetical protein
MSESIGEPNVGSIETVPDTDHGRLVKVTSVSVKVIGSALAAKEENVITAIAAKQ